VVVVDHGYREEPGVSDAPAEYVELNVTIKEIACS
jgi:hypothetical protein